MDHLEAAKKLAEFADENLDYNNGAQAAIAHALIDIAESLRRANEMKAFELHVNGIEGEFEEWRNKLPF